VSLDGKRILDGVWHLGCAYHLGGVAAPDVRRLGCVRTHLVLTRQGGEEERTGKGGDAAVGHEARPHGVGDQGRGAAGDAPCNEIHCEFELVC